MWTRLAAALLVAGCAAASLAGASQSASTTGTPFAGSVTEEPSPAPEGSAEPFLVVDRNGRVRLSWLESRPGGGHRFRMSENHGAQWSPPTTIVEGANLLANWADVPSIFVTSNDTLAAHWLEIGATRGSYHVRLKTSPDGGRTWTPAVTPHRDASAAEHGFVSFFEAPGAGLGVAWLDGRLIAERGREGSMSLRAAMVSGGQPGEEMVVDLRVCDCCPTAAARTDRGVVVAYRDRTADEIRDISVSRLVDGRWTNATTVANDGWQINACPVNGPAIAASGRTVAVAWFTMADHKPRTRVAFSSDDGETFGAPIEVNAGTTQGRLGLVMLDADRVLVSSIDRAGDGAQIVVREVRRDGRMSQPVTVAPTTPERTAGFPRMVASGRRVWFAWTDAQPGAAPRVRVAMVRTR
jgi:hypothetical protein